MKYLVLKGTVIGGSATQAGDVVEVPESEVKALLAMKRIAEVAEKPTATTNRAVGLDDDTKPKKRGRPKKKAD
jgi:hypothetical protein